jgi:hypothetical protein
VDKDIHPALAVAVAAVVAAFSGGTIVTGRGAVAIAIVAIVGVTTILQPNPGLGLAGVHV